MTGSYVQPLPPRDQHHLLAAEGWLELGNHREAEAELEEITPEFRTHPHVLELRWAVSAQAGKWEACVGIAQTLIDLLPDHEFGWIHRSFALHELKRTQEAFDRLCPALDKFPKQWLIPYNLACYCAQIGRLEESRQWLEKAVAIDPRHAHRAAIDDPDLTPLRNSLR